MRLNDRYFTRVKIRFITAIVGLVFLSVGSLGVVLYQTNNIRFSDDVSSQELHSVVSSSPEVIAYLEQEKDFEAHFISIANLVKQDQQKSLGNIVLIMTAIVLIATLLLGYLIARKLLTPVYEAYASQERFLQDAAHELRNPLAVMSAAIENAEKNPQLTDESTFVQTVKRQTKRLGRINEDLLFLEKLNTETPTTTINISELLFDVIEDLQSQVNHKKLTLKNNIEENCLLHIHSTDFIKLTKNIIENAIKYSKSGKAITISLKKDGKNVIFMVKDQGIGIPKKDLASIGKRFYRATNAQKHDGTGLGVAIVQKITNRYNGSFVIDSRVNKGTTVTIKL